MYHTHGVLMLLSWILFIPVAIFIKRYFKYSKKEFPRLFKAPKKLSMYPSNVKKFAMVGAAICISCSWLTAHSAKSKGGEKLLSGIGHPHAFFGYISMLFFFIYFFKYALSEAEEPPRRGTDFVPDFNTAISTVSGLIAYLYFVLVLRYVAFEHESRRTECCSPFFVMFCVWLIFFVAFHVIMTMYFYWSPWALGIRRTGYLTFGEVFYQGGFWIANLSENKIRINLLRAYVVLSVVFAISFMALLETH